MRKHKSSTPRFAICVDNANYLASLDLCKIYRVLPDEDAEEMGQIRVIDNDAEDYLYPEEYFILIQFSPEVRRSLLEALRKGASGQNPPQKKLRVK